MSTDRSTRMAHYVIGLHGSPSFARRAADADDEWEALRGRCRLARAEMLKGVQWALKSCAARLLISLDEDTEVAVRQVRDAVAAVPGVALSPAIAQPLHSLAGAIDRFNGKWRAFLAE